MLGKKKARKANTKSVTSGTHASIPLILPSQLICDPRHDTLKGALAACGYGEPIAIVQEQGTMLQYTHPDNAPGGFVVNLQAVQIINSFRSKFSVLMVGGPQGSHKASLLSLLLEDAGVPGPCHFPSCSQHGAAGLWVWPQLVDMNGKSVLIMDCESFNPCDPSTKDYLRSLFGIGCLLSSEVIYNEIGFPLTLQKVATLDEVAGFVQTSTHELLSSGAPQNEMPFLTYCLRDWPQDIPLDPTHPLVIEASDSSTTQLAKDYVGGHMFCSLPNPVLEAPQRPKKKKKKAQPSKNPDSVVKKPKKPKPKAKAKAPKGWGFEDCGPSFCSKVHQVGQWIAKKLPKGIHSGPEFVRLIYAMIAAARMAADGKGLEADVTKLVQVSIAKIRTHFMSMANDFPIPPLVIKDATIAAIKEEGSSFWNAIQALGHKTLPPAIRSEEQSAVYLGNLMEADVQSLMSQNQIIYQKEVENLVARLVQERVREFPTLQSWDSAVKVWPSQIPQSLMAVTEHVQTLVSEQMHQILSEYQGVVREALQQSLWRLVAPFFELMSGHAYPTYSVPDLANGVDPIAASFQQHLDTLLFPSVGVARELEKSCLAPDDCTTSVLPPTIEVTQSFASLTEGVPGFLLTDIAALVPEIKARLGKLCECYVRKEVGRVFEHVLHELLLPMKLGEPIFQDRWLELPNALVDIHASDTYTLPEDLQMALQVAVFNGPVVLNRDMHRARLEAHHKAILQLVSPAIAQIFTDAHPSHNFQQQLQVSLHNLISGCTNNLMELFPELCQQVIIVIEDAPCCDTDEVERRVQQQLGFKPIYVVADSGNSYRLIMDSIYSAFQVLQCEQWPVEWGFNAIPLQTPRVLLRNLPITADEASIIELVRMYCDIHLAEVNVTRPFAELIVSTEEEAEQLLELGTVRVIGAPCDLTPFDGFDLIVPRPGQDAPFPTKAALQESLQIGLAYVEARDAYTVRVGVWSPFAAEAVRAMAMEQGFLFPEEPKAKYRPEVPTFLAQFSPNVPITVNTPIEEYQNLNWDPMEYKQQVGALVNKIRMSVPKDKLAAAIHKDDTLRNYRRLAQLSTLAAAAKRYYFAGSERVELGPVCQTIHNYTNVLPSPGRPSFAATEIVIDDVDMMELAGDMARSGMRVLMLNMANPTEPGGGWMTGAAAQEEDLIRRSDYSLGFRGGGVAGQMAKYPIKMFGGILTEEVSIFRGPEQEGYPFLAEPFTVGLMAIAAFNVHNYIPPGQSARSSAVAKMPDGTKVLTDEVCVYTRRKIETLLRGAIEHKYDTLVLSALGCGAFGNPSVSMANIFHELLLEYAGYFKKIHFAIKNEAICDMFTSIIQPKYSCAEAGIYHHVSYKKEDKPICALGAKCMDVAHEREAYHVPLCSRRRGCLRADKEGYQLHTLLSRHQQDCPQGGLCPMIDEENHKVQFAHPEEYCSLEGECQSMDLDHLRSKRHLPTCENGGSDSCPLYHDAKHRMQLRHPQKPCPMMGQCYMLDDPHHIAAFAHPFSHPCPDTPNCNDTSKAHLEQYSHVCKDGSACKVADQKEHRSRHIHFPPHNCPDPGCTRVDEDHLGTYAHPGVPDIRPPCKAGAGCPLQHELEHVRQHAHPDTSQELCAVAPMFEGQTPGAEIDFAANVQQLKMAILEWMRRTSICPPICDSPEFQRIVEFFRNSRPVHRCSFDKLQNMLRTGAVLSLHMVETLLSNVAQMVDLVLTHPMVLEVVHQYAEHRSALRDMVKNKLLLEVQKQVKNLKAEECSGEMVHYDVAKVRYYEETLRREFGPLMLSMADSIPLLDQVIEGMVQSAVAVRKAGLSFDRDKEIGTDKSIFTIQGINIAGAYGRIRLIFHPDIMYHPNFYVTPMAAVFFANASDCPSQYALNRPWIDHGYSKPWAMGGKDWFCRHMMHPSSADMYETLALEFVARVVHLNNLKDARVVTWDQVMAYWHTYTHNPDKNVPLDQRELESSHWAPEGHCPGSMPLSYVEHVILSQETLQDTFTPLMQQTLMQTFGSKVHVEPTEQAAHEKSVQLATMPRKPRKGYCLTLVPDVNETYLPVIRQPSKPLHFYFKAKGAFAVVFSSEPSDLSPARQAFTMIINKTEVIIFEGNTLTPLAKRKVFAQLSNFNARLDTSNFIFYYCALDPKKNEVILDHWGPSQLHSTTKGLVFNINPFPIALRYVSVKAMEGVTVFHDVHQRLVRMSPVVDDKIPRMPACPDGANCVLSYDMDPKDTTYLTHTTQYLHPCEWGENCIDNDPAHQAKFSHQRAPHGKCNLGKACPRKQDLRHRQQYTHDGLRAFLLRCKNGEKAACPDVRRDPDHCTKYYHEDDTGAGKKGGFSTVYQVCDVDDENVEGDIYNMAVAGKTAFGADVERDAFGVALGAEFDLAKPGSRVGWNVLVGNFGQRHELTLAALEQCAFVSLRNLGFTIQYTEKETEFVKLLNRGPDKELPKPIHHLAGIPRNSELLQQWHVVWIVSGPQMSDPRCSPVVFADAVAKVHFKGNGLLLWAENEPFYYHANLVLPKLQHTRTCPLMQLIGNTCGKGQIMTPGLANQRMRYGSHMITTGVEKLFEGNTICYPTATAEFQVLGTSSAGFPVLLYGDAHGANQGTYCGRVVIDNGWTKLVPELWNTAGTPRYISNVTSWLAFLERMSRKWRIPVDSPVKHSRLSTGSNGSFGPSDSSRNSPSLSPLPTPGFIPSGRTSPGLLREISTRGPSFHNFPGTALNDWRQPQQGKVPGSDSPQLMGQAWAQVTGHAVQYTPYDPSMYIQTSQLHRRDSGTSTGSWETEEADEEEEDEEEWETDED